MKKIIYGLFLAVLPFIYTTAESAPNAYVSGETLYLDQEYQPMPAKKAKKAAYYGVVKDVNADNIASIAVYDKKDNTLHAIWNRIASGEGYNTQKGEQRYFYADGTLREIDVYALFHNAKNGYTISLPVSETLMYPDGMKQEEVTISYKGSKREETYDRKGYFPNGNLQFHETKEGKDAYSLTFYNEAGNVTKEAPLGFVPYKTMPEYSGGQEELIYFLSKSVQYPIECQKGGIQGRVICQFMVAKNGKIEDVKVVRSGGHPLLDKEAIRVLRSMPKWIPGKKRGEPVRVKYTVPVNFALE